MSTSDNDPPDNDPPDEHVGSGIIAFSWVGTGVYLAVALPVTAGVHALDGALVAISLVLFGAGLVIFLLAYIIAIGRSRHDLIGMGGLYFLAGTAPRGVRRHLLGSLALEVIVATVTASLGFAAAPEGGVNPLAFGVLTPVFGLGLVGLWSARFGRFPPRPADESPRRLRGAKPPVTHRPLPGHRDERLT
jgi:hypothetical protein